MSLFAVSFQIRNVEINARAVHDAIDDSERSQLEQIGRELDDMATGGLRFRGRSSRPGESPSSHSTGRVSLRNVQSAYDAATHSVVVGSIGMPGHKLPGGKTIPQLLEFGGVASVTKPSGKRMTVRYAARPNMQPTLDRYSRGSGIRRAWIGSIGGRS